MRIRIGYKVSLRHQHKVGMEEWIQILAVREK